jgi:hypothetical protein
MSKVLFLTLMVILPLKTVVADTAYVDTPFVEIVEHEACNEIRLNNQGLRWSEQSGGGSNSVNQPSLKALNNNMLDEIHFGQNALLTLKFNGKRFVPDAVKPSQDFAIEAEALLDHSDAIIGKFIGFTDNDRVTGRFDDKAAPYGVRDHLLMAVIYVNPDLESVRLVVPCEYVAGDIPTSQLSSGKCLWIDQYSHPSNRKPYCW